MRTDVVITCDLCKNTIDQEQAWPLILYPLDDVDKRRIRDDVEAAFGPLSGNPMFGMIAPMLGSLIPDRWKLEVCRGCIDGIVPQLRELKTEQIIAKARQLAERRKRQAVPVDDDD
jgi:hypothetical protein